MKLHVTEEEKERLRTACFNSETQYVAGIAYTIKAMHVAPVHAGGFDVTLSLHRKYDAHH